MQTDTRAIQVRNNEFYTSPARIAKSQHICEFCYVTDRCKLKTREACSIFMPVIWFQRPAEGLSGNYSTFRIGRSWQKRLKVGSFVGIALKDPVERVSIARVVAVHSGTLRSVIDRHASTNHLMQARKIPFDKAPKNLEGVVKRIYGPHLLNSEEKQCTAIYVSHDDQSDKRFEKTWPLVGE